MTTLQSAHRIQIDPELVILTDFLRECPYQMDDVTPGQLIEACTDLIDRLGLTTDYLGFREALD
ncbi:hypothetical protein [Novosphingobium guangzhouense]|nr:hypothetical protein [Novosphingobium guangzhouense]